MFEERSLRDHILVFFFLASNVLFFKSCKAQSTVKPVLSKASLCLMYQRASVRKPYGNVIGLAALAGFDGLAMMLALIWCGGLLSYVIVSIPLKSAVE